MEFLVDDLLLIIFDFSSLFTLVKIKRVNKRFLSLIQAHYQNNTNFSLNFQNGLIRIENPLHIGFYKTFLSDEYFNCFCSIRSMIRVFHKELILIFNQNKSKSNHQIKIDTKYDKHLDEFKFKEGRFIFQSNHQIKIVSKYNRHLDEFKFKEGRFIFESRQSGGFNIIIEKNEILILKLLIDIYRDAKNRWWDRDCYCGDCD